MRKNTRLIREFVGEEQMETEHGGGFPIASYTTCLSFIACSIVISHCKHHSLPLRHLRPVSLSYMLRKAHF